jgi:hypothetical protein
MDKTYKLVPNMIVDFALKARIHKGYRLIMRTLQHSIDHQTESILQAYGHIVEYDNQPCFLVHHRVKASMRNEIHNTYVCFNEKKLLVVGVIVKRGGEERVVCVHILPVIYQMSLLCFDGLADNIVVELSHHWRRISPQIINDNRDKFKTALLTILSACQQN